MLAGTLRVFTALPYIFMIFTFPESGLMEEGPLKQQHKEIIVLQTKVSGLLHCLVFAGCILRNRSIFIITPVL